MEDFILLELALKLKEKGFTCEYPFAMYNKYEQFCPLYSSDKHYFGIDDFDEHACIAPTIFQVLKWLGKNHKLHISTKPYPCEDGLMWMYEVRKFSSVLVCVVVNKTGFHEPEQAALAGIEYCLDNMI